MRTLEITALAGVLALGLTASAGAQCTIDDDANAARKVTKQVAKCNDKRLSSGSRPPARTSWLDAPGRPSGRCG
jgi:hypothetical protein